MTTAPGRDFAPGRLPPWMVALLLSLIAATGLMYFPGTQYLTSDTQIYVAMLEHARDPAVLAKDPLAQHPHLGLSLYDEMVNGVRAVTGLPVYPVLYGFQVLFRLVLALGAYLLALGICKGQWESLWMAAMVHATAFIPGPSVMVVEYDPVPRGYTLALNVLASACVLHGRIWLAAWMAAAGLLFQAGVAYPFLACFGLYLLFGRTHEPVWMRLRFVLPFVATLGLVLLSAGMHGGGSASLATVPDWLRDLHHLRAAYNYPSLWHPAVLWVPVGLGISALGVGWAIRKQAGADFRWFLLGVPLVGLLSIPFAWLSMEHWRWFLMAQLQPARALAFLYALAVPVFLGAGLLAVRQGRWMAGWLCFVAGLSIPFCNQLVFFAGANGWPATRFRYLWAPGLALLALLAFRLWTRRRVLAAVLLALVTVAPFGILREGMGTNAFATDARSAEIAELAAWAQAHTDADAVFAFPGFGKGSQPGVFRAQALRAVYTDWKSGGQVNFSADFARLWWQRWNAVMTAKGWQSADAARLRALGIQYVVVPPGQAAPEWTPQFQNSAFVVYALHAAAQGSPAIRAETP
ncbi:MAG: hypothetical protein MUF01_16625 [Bryobacterales bacterium]|nr:hypothetical protein [Bryobacterales bacterium]